MTPQEQEGFIPELECELDPADFMAFCEEAEAVLGRHVDVVTEDGLSPYIRERVLAEAIPL